MDCPLGTIQVQIVPDNIVIIIILQENENQKIGTPKRWKLDLDEDEDKSKGNTLKNKNKTLVLGGTYASQVLFKISRKKNLLRRRLIEDELIEGNYKASNIRAEHVC